MALYTSFVVNIYANLTSIHQNDRFFRLIHSKIHNDNRKKDSSRMEVVERSVIKNEIVKEENTDGYYLVL